MQRLGALIAVDTQKGERETGCDAREDLHNPFLGFIEKRAEFDPPGIDAGGEAYPEQLGLDVRGNVEGRPGRKKAIWSRMRGAKSFPHR
jgi:hypothetical protein